MIENFGSSESGQKSKNLWNLVFAGCGCLVLVAAIAGFLFWKFWIFGKAPTRVVRSHLEAINLGSYEKAYDYFSDDYRNRVSLRAFRNEFSEFSSLLPFRAMNLSRLRVENDHAWVDGTITGRDGAIFPIHYELIKKGADWNIDSFQWISPGERENVKTWHNNIPLFQHSNIPIS